MDDNKGQYFVLNGSVKEGKTLKYTGSTPSTAAYEVIRVISGVPLFFMDHYDRMKGTLDAIGCSMELTVSRLRDEIKKLLAENKADNCNVKVVIYNEECRQKRLVYISESYYPTEQQADEGVKTGLLRIERHNPNAKVLDSKYKDAVNAKILETGYFEVILVDNTGRVTEGSKSNTFFVKDNSVYTAPGESVLKGITRKYVFQACANVGYSVIEQFIAADDLDLLDGAFLSGTSIKVLPVRAIDHIELNSPTNPVIAAVRNEYDRLLEKYIEAHAKIW